VNSNRLSRFATDDRVFWDRLAEMPALEAEQELVSRREGLMLEVNMLRNEMSAAKHAKREKEAIEIGRAIRDADSQLGLIGERIKYMRKVEDAIRWRKAVETVLGQEALEACLIWRVQEGREADDMRRSWAGGRRE
jgi:hypothetical protein